MADIKKMWLHNMWVGSKFKHRGGYSTRVATWNVAKKMGSESSLIMVREQMETMGIDVLGLTETGFLKGNFDVIGKVFNSQDYQVIHAHATSMANKGGGG